MITDVIAALDNNENIVPVIGFELLPVVDNGQRFPYLTYLAQKIAADNNIQVVQGNFNSPVDLFNAVMHKLLVMNNYDQKVPTTTLCKYAKSIHHMVDTSLLEKIVSITPFKYFLNLTFTTHLQEVVDRYRQYPNGSVQQSNYPYILKNVPKPDDLIKNESSFEVVIYNLFGLAYDDPASAKTIFNYYYTDDQILRLTSDINKRYDVDLKNLKEIITSSSLLFLGCQFPDWLLRFFIYTLKPNSFDLLGALAARVFVDYCCDNSTSFFLSRHSFKFQGQLATGDLVNNLYTELSLHNYVISPYGTQHVFISYTRDNLPLVKKIVDQLFSHGVSVWFDRIKMFPGSQINKEVTDGIDNCRTFLPVITDQSIAKQPNDYVRQEWLYYKQKFANTPKIIPLLNKGVNTGILGFSMDNEFATPGANLFYITVTEDGLTDQDIKAIKKII